VSTVPDALLGGRLHLHQPPRGAHRAGTDGVLLAHLLAPAPGERLCDVGSGPGIVGLACALAGFLASGLDWRFFLTSNLSHGKMYLGGMEVANPEQLFLSPHFWI